ncbi:MAG TPA: polymorphic toxin-type HINT domain-containing protein, partial [Acidimicrobiales bacterium]|nr:polymorphic toxin-type HINT domain-containing protein [Acidimicrobiales bacterium]
TTLTSTAGGVDLEVDDDATATIQACRDVSIFTKGDLNATVTTSDGDVEALALGSLEGSYTASGDVEIDALKDITGASVSAAGNAYLTSLAGASGISVSGTLGASAWAGNDLSGTVNSSQGEVDVSAIGGINVTVHAGADALVEGLADVQANVTSTGTSVVAGLGSVSGPVNAGADAELFAGGDLTADVTAAGNIWIEAIGNLSGTASAGADLTVTAYGNLDAGDFHADQDITRVWVRGDLSGDLSAGGNIALVECYGSIDATLTAATIGTVEAHGPIAGTFTASSSIGAVASGGAITAALDSPSIGSVSPYQHGLLADWPKTPEFSDALDIELRDAARAELEALAAQIAADKAAVLAELPADKAAAAPSYHVSIGDVKAAIAWFQSTAIQMLAEIAAAKLADQQQLAAAQISLKSFFAAEDVRLAAERAADQRFFDTLKAELAQITADREGAAAFDQVVATAILADAQKAHEAYLKKLDHVRDMEWPIMFEKELFELMLNRIQLVLDVIGVLDPTGAADGINAVISLLRGNFLDAAVSALGAIFPYLGDIAKLTKLGKFGKFADDGIEALRRVGGDFLTGVAARAGFESSCELAAKIGLDGKRLGKLLPIGCFEAGTRVWLAQDDNPINAAHIDIFVPPPDASYTDRWLWTSVLVGVAIAGWGAGCRIARRRERDEKAERDAAIMALFDENVVVRGGESMLSEDEFQAVRSLAPLGTPILRVDTAFNNVSTKTEDGASGASAPSVSCSTGSVPAVAVLLRPDAGSFPARTKNRANSWRSATRDDDRKTSGTRSRSKTGWRSVFGVTWLIMFLALGAACATGVLPSPQQEPRASIRTTGLTDTAPSPEARRAPRTKAIEEIVDGDRIYSSLSRDEIERHEEEIGLDLWLRVKLRMDIGPREYIDITLRRPIEWFIETDVKPAGSIRLDMPEFGAVGRAEVVAVEPYPEFEAGNGAMVTGTFARTCNETVALEISGLDAPIRTTPNHPFQSEDRGEFVAAGDLRIGETLKAADGRSAEVLSAAHFHSPTTVYNLEVEGEHVYYVSDRGILVHNTCVYLYAKNGVTKYVGITGSFARRFAEHLRINGFEIEKIPGLNNLTRQQARGVEQALIEHYKLENLFNKINSISRKNKKYKRLTDLGKQILNEVGYPGF